ncbi:phosphatase [Anaerobacillus alkalidiazotrophicus]|uniref:Phosphatase n=1 Tax=Anaerobacillus alkalidiazotrophicus TaxID=472963 RepID=A0A1S2MBW8_9BACI|nr:Cof-type HAD-IIB family hydrolase [Anaerobacillus alkalidiazotrophicus]OIJ22080.1 phosphatase [Anaerobacillus alkalidiazotrophicus]
MNQQIIFFDIDGTLLDHEKQLPASTKYAVKELKEKGYEVIIATGRAPYLFKELREELDINSYVSLNGQYVVVNNEVIFKNPLEKNALKSFSEFALKNNHPVVYQSHEGMKTTTDLHPGLEECVQSLQCYYPEIDPMYLEGRDIYQSWILCNEEEESSYKGMFDKFEFIRWHEKAMDVLPIGGSKARGIRAVIDHLGVHEDDIYAFGDGLNDIEMLKFVKHSVAMGNAPEAVKKVAKHVTKHVDDDGIVHGLELVGLLK